MDVQAGGVVVWSAEREIAVMRGWTCGAEAGRAAGGAGEAVPGLLGSVEGQGRWGWQDRKRKGGPVGL